MTEWLFRRVLMLRTTNSILFSSMYSKHFYRTENKWVIEKSGNFEGRNPSRVLPHISRLPNACGLPTGLLGKYIDPAIRSQ